MAKGTGRGRGRPARKKADAVKVDETFADRLASIPDENVYTGLVGDGPELPRKWHKFTEEEVEAIKERSVVYLAAKNNAGDKVVIPCLWIKEVL